MTQWHNVLLTKVGSQRSNGWSKSLFLENKVVINFNFRHGAKKSGQSGHSFRSYGFFQWKSKMKEFTNVTIHVTSFAVHVNLLFPSWISCQGAWFEAFWDILWHHFHPERVVSFKERAERGWKSGARSLSWKSGWNPCTLATTRRWNYPKTFFRFQERAVWKCPEVQLNFYIVNFMVC